MLTIRVFCFAACVPFFAGSFAHDAHAGTVDYSGTIGIGSCSGSFVRFDYSEDADDAMVLTAGHCAHQLGDEVFVENRETLRGLQVKDESGDQVIQLLSKQLIYATMLDTDLALLRAPLTYEELRLEHGVEAFVIARTPAPVDTSVAVIAGHTHNAYTCTVEKVVDTLLEADWEWHQALRLSLPGCDTGHGDSGAPTVLEGTRTLVGVHGTGNDDGESCTLNNPCEVDAAGNVLALFRAAYSMPIHELYGCFDAARDLDLTLETCRLPGAVQGPSEEIFTALTNEVVETFQADVQAHGAVLEITRDWEADGVQSWTQRTPDVWRVHVTGGVLRAEEMTRDGFQMVLCHEIGHLLGGYPHAVQGPVVLSVSAEGQADYFAGHVCARRLWGAKGKQNQAAFAAAPLIAQLFCSAGFEAGPERDLCARTAVAGVQMIRALDGDGVSIDTSDGATVSTTLLSGYAEPQCRLDTVLAGAMCQNAPTPWVIPGFEHPEGRNSAAAAEEALEASCRNSDGAGARPSCWFLE